MTHRKETKQLAVILTFLVAVNLGANSVPALAQAGGGAQSAGANGGAGNGTGNGGGKGGNRRRVARAANRIGPGWIKGQDGAQNPNKLKRGMKLQERRQNHQYEQAMNQVKEQQQQQYEKEMLQKLGSQRPVIQENREDIKKVRQATGANGNN